MSTRHPIQRAFELARSGTVHSVEDLRRALKGEEYDNVEGHLSGMAIRKQLKDILEEEAVKRVMPAS